MLKLRPYAVADSIRKTPLQLIAPSEFHVTTASLLIGNLKAQFKLSMYLLEVVLNWWDPKVGHGIIFSGS